MDTFDALADPIRRDLILAVAAAPASAGELAARHPVISRPAVSRHLRVLVTAGVLVGDADGRRRMFRLTPRGLDDVRAFLDAAAAAPGTRMVAAFGALDTEVARSRRERRHTPAAREASTAGGTDDPSATGPSRGDGSADQEHSA